MTQQHQSTGHQTRRAYKTNITARQNVKPASGGMVSEVHTDDVPAFLTLTGVVVVAVVVVVIDGLFDVVKSVCDVKTDRVVGGRDVTGVEVTTIGVVERALVVVG